MQVRRLFQHDDEDRSELRVSQVSRSRSWHTVSAKQKAHRTWGNGRLSWRLSKFIKRRLDSKTGSGRRSKRKWQKPSRSRIEWAEPVAKYAQGWRRQHRSWRSGASAIGGFVRPVGLPRRNIAEFHSFLEPLTLSVRCRLRQETHEKAISIDEMTVMISN